jgi:hypothetical protein
MNLNETILCKDEAENDISGNYAVDGTAIVVTALDGRHLKTQLGNTSADTMAKILLRELARLKSQ